MLKSVYSMMAVVQIKFFLYKMEAGKNGAGHWQERGRERKREVDKGSRRQSIGENWKRRWLRKVTIGKDT